MVKYIKIYSIKSGIQETNVVLYLTSNKKIYFEFKNYENISIEEMLSMIY